MPLSGKRVIVVDESEELGSLLAAAARARGAEAVICAGGRAALAEVDARGADAAFVDLPLRDVRGDAFLLALRDRGVPCLAVSGVLKGARYAEMARQFGALAFLEKPFDLEAAFALLEEAVASAAPLLEPEMPALTPLPAFPTVRLGPPALAQEPLPPLSPDLSALPTPTASTAPASPSQARDPAPVGDERGQGSTSRSTPPALDFDPEHPDFDSIVFSPARPALDEVVPGLPPQAPALAGLASPLPGGGAPAVPRPRRPGMPQLPEGELAATRVPRLLAALHVAQATGALTLEREGVKKLVLFERGRPVFAVSNVPSERFGARAVRQGLLSAEQLQALLVESGGRMPAAEALMARGHLDPDRRARMVREQIAEILWSTFAWRDGSYRLLVSALSRRPPVAVDLFPGDLILEGLRRTATLEELRAGLSPALTLAPPADPAFGLYDLTLSSAEASLLAHADGTKTVADLVLLSPLEERDALALLQGCRDIGLLDEVGRVLAGTRRIGFM